MLSYKNISSIPETVTSSWFNIIDVNLQSGYVGRFIYNNIIKNSAIFLLINVILIAKILNVTSYIKILEKYKDEKEKEAESSINDLNLKYIGL